MLMGKWDDYAQTINRKYIYLKKPSERKEKE